MSGLPVLLGVTRGADVSRRALRVSRGPNHSSVEKELLMKYPPQSALE